MPSSSKSSAKPRRPSPRTAPASCSAGTSTTTPAASYAGYQRTKDTAWLDGAQKVFEYCIGKMRAGPDGYKGWIGEDQTDRGTWADTHVGDAIIVAHMLSFAELVLKDPA